MPLTATQLAHINSDDPYHEQAPFWPAGESGDAVTYDMLIYRDYNPDARTGRQPAAAQIAAVLLAIDATDVSGRSSIALASDLLRFKLNSQADVKSWIVTRIIEERQAEGLWFLQVRS
jgi:hypothetical protein|tara:strand:+ start:1257 stop:1610 length:354 start_codon:yes stop_codon:yes gene_type:complete